MIDFLLNITFKNPEAFFLLLLLLPIGVFYLFHSNAHFATLKMPGLLPALTHFSWRGRFRLLLPILRILAFLALVTALARPQESLKEENIKAEGIDIFLVMDLSWSMLAQDFKPNRLESSKKIAAEFVDRRKYDRIGLAVFAGEAFTQCPLTTDHRVLKEFLGSLKYGILEDGTAIGMGLATAVNRIKDGNTKSKIVILITDGENNLGYIKPMTATEIAKEFDVKVYTIGIGTEGKALMPVQVRGNGEFIYDKVEVDFDETLLKEIAKLTGGKYYRATSSESLQRIYAEIDQLEKTELEVTSIKIESEAFHIFAFLALIFIFLEISLRYTFFRTIP